MLVATAVMIGLAHFGPLHVWHGLVLVAMLAYMLGSAALAAGEARAGAVAEGLDEVDVDPHMPGRRLAFLLVAGLIGLPLGAGLLIEGAQGIARSAGVSEEVIGLTLVAIGTSLPELATAVMAALRSQADVALGNVIGSNMFNILAILGITSLVAPLPISPRLLHVDIWIMAAASLALIPFVFFKRDIGRGVGVVFLVAYAVYIFSLF